MIMEILTGSGGDSVLFARYTGGILSSSTKKRGGGILSGGDFVLHSGKDPNVKIPVISPALRGHSKSNCPLL